MADLETKGKNSIGKQVAEQLYNEGVLTGWEILKIDPKASVENVVNRVVDQANSWSAGDKLSLVEIKACMAKELKLAPFETESSFTNGFENCVKAKTKSDDKGVIYR